MFSSLLYFLWLLLAILIFMQIFRLLHYKFLKFKRSNQYRKQLRRYRYCVPSVVVVLIAFPIISYLNHFGDRHMSSDPEQWGQMGDFFGGMLNPILAFASFIALLYTIKLQSKEMQDTREEAQLSRVAHEAAVKAAQANLFQQAAQEELKFAMDLIVNRIHEASSLLRNSDNGISIIDFANSAKTTWGDRGGAPVSRDCLNQLHKNGHGVNKGLSARDLGLCNFLARDLHLVSTVVAKLNMDSGKDSLLDLYCERVAELCFFGACVNYAGNLTVDYIKKNASLNDKFIEYHAQNGFEVPEIIPAKQPIDTR